MPGFIAASLVDVRSGTTLVNHSVRAGFDLSVAAVFNSEIAKLVIQAPEAFESESTVENVVLTLNDQVHILKMVDAGAAFVYLAVDRASTNLATACYLLNDSIDLTTRQTDREGQSRQHSAASL